MTLHRACLGFLSVLACSCVQAQPWVFAEPVTVADRQEGVFHHLQSSGRRNIAVSGDTVAVAWEDDRDGTPRVYLARKRGDAQAFSSEVRISGDGDAYEPSLVALDGQRFAIAWEEDARIHVRLVTPAAPGPVAIVDDGEATQASLARHGQRLMLAYSRRDGRYGRVYIQGMKIDGPALKPMKACAVDAEPPRDDQLYPTLVAAGDRTIVAWEDRRPGHTIIMAAQNDGPNGCEFTPPRRISEAVDSLSMTYGKGHGVARVAMAGHGDGRVLAAWADKRNFREGYDIYAAPYAPGREHLFGANSKVQDSFGGVAQQWHVTLAGDASGRLVAGWDDKRDGDANIMLSWLEDGDWSDDIAVPGASGAGEQNHPSISLDDRGNLHLAWIERGSVDGPTRVRYVFGRRIEQ